MRAFGEVRPGFFGARDDPPALPHRARRASRCPQALTPGLPDHRRPVAGDAAHARARGARPRPTRRHAARGAARSATRSRALAPSVRLLHRPPPGADARALTERTHPAWRRMKFDELLAQQLSMRLAYRERRARAARRRCPSNGPLLRRFLGKLPFRLTRAQSRAMAEIAARSARSRTRCSACCRATSAAARPSSRRIGCLARGGHRLPGGGDGAHRDPRRAALPQVLRLARAARRAHRLAARRPAGGGAASAARRRSPRARRASRSARMRCSRRAWRSRASALAIVDEQHRFGVKQRLALRRKGEARGGRAAPADDERHADPAHAVDDLLRRPRRVGDRRAAAGQEAGRRRKPVAAARRDEVLARIRDACAEGQQAYWVCPVIEESEGAATCRRRSTRTRGCSANCRACAVGLRARAPARRRRRPRR